MPLKLLQLLLCLHTSPSEELSLFLRRFCARMQCLPPLHRISYTSFLHRSSDGIYEVRHLDIKNVEVLGGETADHGFEDDETVRTPGVVVDRDPDVLSSSDGFDDHVVAERIPELSAATLGMTTNAASRTSSIELQVCTLACDISETASIPYEGRHMQEGIFCQEVIASGRKR